MAVKLADVIFALLMGRLVGSTFTLLVNGNASKYYPYTIIKLYADSRASRYHLCFINGSAGSCHLGITIESH